jgi:hypothetical protein
MMTVLLSRNTSRVGGATALENHRRIEIKN